MDAIKDIAKTAAAETANAYGWGMVVLVCVLLAFFVLVIYTIYLAARWAKPQAEKFIQSAVSTMERNAETLEKQAETLDKMSESSPCRATECKWQPPPPQKIDLPGLRGQQG